MNVPMGIWIDEEGRVVRPAEPAWTTSRTSTYGGKPLVTEGEVSSPRSVIGPPMVSEARTCFERGVRGSCETSLPGRDGGRSGFKLAVWFQQASQPNGRSTSHARSSSTRTTGTPSSDWSSRRRMPAEVAREFRNGRAVYPKLDISRRAETEGVGGRC